VTIRKRCARLALVAFGTLVTCAALSQDRRDPIGALARTSTFDRAQRVDVGRTKAGKIACYFREEGSSHSLDIGITTDGAFMRLETGDSREATPAPPLRVFAGKQMAKGEYASNEFAILQEYRGAIEYYTPQPERGDFVLIARGPAKAFLDMVARARTEFVVVQSVTDKKLMDLVAIYKFKAPTVPALLSCAEARVR
jgi:hypothetical protein